MTGQQNAFWEELRAQYPLDPLGSASEPGHDLAMARRMSAEEVEQLLDEAEDLPLHGEEIAAIVRAATVADVARVMGGEPGADGVADRAVEPSLYGKQPWATTLSRGAAVGLAAVLLLSAGFATSMWLWQGSAHSENYDQMAAISTDPGFADRVRHPATLRVYNFARDGLSALQLAAAKSQHAQQVLKRTKDRCRSGSEAWLSSTAMADFADLIREVGKQGAPSAQAIEALGQRVTQSVRTLRDAVFQGGSALSPEERALIEGWLTREF